MHKLFYTLLAASYGLLAGTAAQASTPFDGKTFQVTYFYPDYGTIHRGPTDIVGGGPSVFWDINTPMTVTLSGNTLTVADSCPSCDFNPTPANGVVLTDAYDVLAPFTSVTIDGGTNIAGFDASRVTFDDDHVYLYFGGLVIATGPGVFAVDLGAAGVPEPASWAIIIAGFGLTGARLRRRRARTARP